MCADGNWDFHIDSDNKKLTKISPNPSGESELSFYKRDANVGYSCNHSVYADNSAWGDDTDAFDTTYNNVLSPVGNPSTINSANKLFAIEIRRQDGENYSLKVMFDKFYSGKPSKPQGLKAVIDSGSVPALSWQPNREPDLDYYNLYFTQMPGGKSEIIKISIEHPDSSISKTLPDISLDNSTIYTFYVTAVDKDGLESVHSDRCELNWNEVTNLWKIANFAYE